jgi:hypothetical protein
VPSFAKPPARGKVACLAFVLTIFVVEALGSASARAQSTGHVEEGTREELGQSSSTAGPTDPFRGSTFTFNQSLGTQTAHLEPSPQLSYVPYYGWWLSLRPRWNFTDTLRLQARFDYFKEFTNSEDTTYLREDVIGDLWTDLVYTSPLAPAGPWHRTKVTLGLRAQWPTSKASRGSGTYVTLGALAGVSQTIPLFGSHAPVLPAARIGASFVYLHPFSNATTPTEYGGFGYVRENTDGYSFVSDQLSGQTLVAHQLISIVNGDLQITPRLSFGLSFVWIDQWHYAPTSTTVTTLTGPVTPTALASDTQFTQLLWGIAALEYEVADEVTLGLGYYNLTNAIAPDGTRRSPFAGGVDNTFWSPGNAFVFFEVTAHLDRILEDAAPRFRPKEASATLTSRGTSAQSASARAAPSHANDANDR